MFKHFIRRIIVKLKIKTDAWVVPEHVWKVIDDENYEEALPLLEKVREEWPNDPEMVYASSILKFFTEPLDNELES